MTTTGADDHHVQQKQAAPLPLPLGRLGAAARPKHHHRLGNSSKYVRMANNAKPIAPNPKPRPVCVSQTADESLVMSVTHPCFTAPPRWPKAFVANRTRLAATLQK